MAVPLADEVRDVLAEPDSVTLKLRDTVGVPLAEAVREALELPVSVPLPVAVRLAEADPEKVTLPLPLRVGLRVPVPDSDVLGLPLLLAVLDCVADAAGERLLLSDTTADAENDPVPLLLGVGGPAGLAEALAVTVRVATLALAVGDTKPDAEKLGLPLGLRLVLALALTVPDTPLLRVPLAEPL